MPALNLNNAEFIKSAANPNGFLRTDEPCIIFAGKSNVGKSSVINRVLNRKNFARVGAHPGKTIHVNYFHIDKKVYFVDLPGYGYASVSKAEKKKWNALIGGYLNDENRQIDLMIQLIDMRHAPSKDDLSMIDFYIDCGLPFIIVFTKADKLKKREREERMEAFRQEIPCFEDITYVEFSAVTGEGVEELRELLDELTEGAEITPVEAFEDEDGGSEDYDEGFEEPEEAVDEDFVEPGSDNPFGGFLKPRGRKN